MSQPASYKIGCIYTRTYVLLSAMCLIFLTFLRINSRMSLGNLNGTLIYPPRLVFPLPRGGQVSENRQIDDTDYLQYYKTGKHKNGDMKTAVRKAFERYQHVLKQIGEIQDAYNHNSTRFDQDLGLLKNPDRRICSEGGPESVEDLLCKKPLRFLPNFENPCWYTPKHHLVCLPYFQLIGLPKCASTDVFHRLCFHPDVLLNDGRNRKETQWWAWDRYGKRQVVARFEDYLKFFATAASTIQETAEGDGKHNKVTGDGSPMDFWDMTFWPRIPQNSGLRDPKVLTPHLLRHVNPDVKLIVVLRDPVDRQYSDYWFIRSGEKNKNAEKLHSLVLKSIDLLHRCTRLHDLRWCLLDWSTRAKLQKLARLNIGFYSIYLREWLKTFPRDQFLFLQTEKYSANMLTEMRRVFKFLQIRDLSETEMQKIVQKKHEHVTLKKQKAEPMLEETKRILHKLYDPFTIDLATLLNDDTFTWNVTLAHFHK